MRLCKMAPQNSTLIDDADGVTTATEMSQYSPILPVKQQRFEFSKPPTEAAAAFIDQANEIPIWILGEPRFVSGITSHTTCNNVIEALIEDEIQNLGASVNDVAVSRDLNDYVISERWRDVEQPLPHSTFILPIWRAWGTKSATNEVKFILKINKQKRITDKDSNENSDTSAKENPPAEEPKTGSCISSSMAGSQIQEKKRTHKSERMHMINKMLRKILKQGETIRDHLSLLTDRQQEIQRVEKLCKKLRQTKNGKKILMEHFFNSAALTSSITSEDELFYQDIVITDSSSNCLKISKSKKEDKVKRNYTESEDEEDDELFLVIENNDDLDSGVHFDINKLPKPQNLQNLQPICSSIEMTEVLLETPKRKKRAQRNLETLKRHTLTTMASSKPSNDKGKFSHVQRTINNDPEFKRTSLKFDTIRREIIVKMNDLKSLLQKEEDLIQKLERKCLKYKLENEIYDHEGGVELKVDEIQENLNKYAKEIVQNELELYRTKLEIRESYLVIEDLKFMLQEKDPITNFGQSEFNRIVARKFETREQGNFQTTIINSPFVDNIHEFCDNNNDSIIV